MGGRAQRLPHRCIADNDDGGLCLEPEKRWRGVAGEGQNPNEIVIVARVTGTPVEHLF